MKKTTTILIIFLFIILGSLNSNAQTTEAEKDLGFYIKTTKRLWKERKLSAMRRVLDEGLKKYPQNASLWDGESAYYLLKKNKNKSLNAAQKAALIKPTDLRFQNIGWIYYNLIKDYQSALIFFKKSESLAKKNKDHYFCTAECYKQLGKKEKAKKYYKHFVGSKPKNKKILNKAIEQLAKLQSQVTPPPCPYRQYYLYRSQ